MQSHLIAAGPVIYPLLLLSVITVALCLEKLFVFIRYPRLRVEQGMQQFRTGKTIPVHGKWGLHAGLNLLQQYSAMPKALREELLLLWLQEQRSMLCARQRCLVLLGTLAPLLGLLGTVLGIITMFQDIAHLTGSVSPHLLADGMWQAMATTGLGLLVAIPALAVGQGGALWVRQKLSDIEKVLNDANLALELERYDFSRLYADKNVATDAKSPAADANAAFPERAA